MPKYARSRPSPAMRVKKHLKRTARSRLNRAMRKAARGKLCDAEPAPDEGTSEARTVPSRPGEDASSSRRPAKRARTDTAAPKTPPKARPKVPGLTTKAPPRSSSGSDSERWGTWQSAPSATPSAPSQPPPSSAFESRPITPGAMSSRGPGHQEPSEPVPPPSPVPSSSSTPENIRRAPWRAKPRRGGN